MDEAIAKTLRLTGSLLTGLLLVAISVTAFLFTAEFAARHLLPAPCPSDELNRLEGYSIKKRPGVVRVLVLGDSIAYGLGVRREDTFSRKLEGMLNAGLPEKRYEVINTGWTNINTTHELNILKDLGPTPIYEGKDKEGFVGLAYKPDLILLSYCLNDVQPSYVRHDLEHNVLVMGTFRWNSGPYALPLPMSLDRYLTRHSLLYKWFLVRYDRLLSRFGLRRYLQETISNYDNNSEGWTEARISLFEILETAQTHGIKMCMFIWPALTKDMKVKYPFTAAHGTIKNFSTSIGIPAHDLLDDFRDMDGEKLKVGFFDAHPNPEGHAIAARAMYKFITENALLP